MKSLLPLNRPKSFMVFYRAILPAMFMCLSLAATARAQAPPPAPPAPPPAAPMRDASGLATEVFKPTIAPTAASAAPATTAGQSRRRAVRATICGNPNVPCRTEITFQPHDLPFFAPKNAIIYDTELFYAVILKSVAAPDDNCDIFIPESERLAAQSMFPDRKVFASRCADPETLFYTNTKPNYRIMAVYAGKTLAEANRVLASVKATGKFPGANVRRMRTGFNGT